MNPSCLFRSKCLPILLGVVAGLLLMMSAGVHREVRAGDDAAGRGAAGRGAGRQADLRGGLTLKEYKSRLSKLRTSASRWIVARVEFPSRCPLCKGVGKTRARAGHRVAVRTCRQCGGHRAWISKKHYRKVYYDMRTPAFQALPGIKDTLGKQYKLASEGKPWPTLVKRYRMRERAMVDDTHGIVGFLFNASKVPVETRWIWTEMPARKGAKKKKFQWYAYDSRSDGPWPETGAEEGESYTGGAYAGSREAWPTDGGQWEDIGRREASTIRRAVARSRITFRVHGLFKQGSSLRVRLKPWARTHKRPVAERAGQDAVRLTRAILQSSPAFDRVESEWSTDWRDPYARVQLRTTWVAALTRAQHDKILWNTRSPDESVQQLEWRTLTHRGWSPVDERPIVLRPDVLRPDGREPSPDEPTPSESTPTEPTPSQPTPSQPVPVPTRPPTRPTPKPRPTPPPLIEEEDWELPEPSAAQLKKGRKGIQQMQALFAEAVKAYNDGVLARREGAHDIYQEKLAEVRSYKGEMDEVWLEEVVAAMPGRDEGEQDAVANEQFGEIWDDVDKIMSMVRKMSVMK